MTALEELSAARVLLNTMPDVVVELDADLKFAKHSPQLASMLQHDVPLCLEGKAMADLLFSEEDLTLFQSNMNEAGFDRRFMADVCHLRLRDCLNNTIRTEMFHISYTGSDELPCHLIGLREFTDFSSVSYCANAGATPAIKADGESMQTSAEVPNVENNAVLHVILSPFGWEVLACSPSLCTLAKHPLRGTRFTDWLQGAATKNMLDVLSASMNEFSTSMEEEHRDVGRVRLALPAIDPSQAVHVRVSCAVCMHLLSPIDFDSSENGGDDDIEMPILCIVLRKMRPIAAVQCKRARGSARGHRQHVGASTGESGVRHQPAMIGQGTHCSSEGHTGMIRSLHTGGSSSGSSTSSDTGVDGTLEAPYHL
eukprot:NODE_8748_length_1472_cov_13.478810.p1 GENE.NODE_8748_length_1472_cov_13.478810~~NODE_8748_length_1472_cov_13.478810.p1  ORF type:complete len:426 (+),score=57.12 NODE_8748_length_1472_cov_13.478810:176-1279(+)